MMSAYSLSEFFESEVILILCIFTSKADAQCCSGVFLLTSLQINCFSSLPQHQNDRQNLGCRDHGKIALY